jgi:hypothetical protein
VPGLFWVFANRTNHASRPPSVGNAIWRKSRTISADIPGSEDQSAMSRLNGYGEQSWGHP